MKEYYCDCRICGHVLRRVSKRTYFYHKPTREEQELTQIPEIVAEGSSQGILGDEERSGELMQDIESHADSNSDGTPSTPSSSEFMVNNAEDVPDTIDTLVAPLNTSLPSTGVLHLAIPISDHPPHTVLLPPPANPIPGDVLAVNTQQPSLETIPVENPSLQEPIVLEGGNEGSVEEESGEPPEAHIHITRVEQLLAQQYIDALSNAMLEESGMSAGEIHNLRNPPTEASSIEGDLGFKTSLKYYVDTIGASNHTYSRVIKTTQELRPDLKFLSHYEIEKQAAKLAGVTTLVHDMCPDACTAFTGPYSSLDSCPDCGASRWKPQRNRKGQLVAAKTFTTIPLGSQLQALYSTPEGAKKMQYRSNKTKEICREYTQDPLCPANPPIYADYVYGSSYLKNVHEGSITSNDILLMLSVDGAQLYEHRASDCWIYIWVIMELSPDHRYKKTHVLPGGFIPGPKKPKALDPFLFPGFHHIAALQREGLVVWDAFSNKVTKMRPIVAFGTADAPGMVYLSGLVGHSGARGCRLYCEVPSRHKPGASHYYPVLRRPNGYHSLQDIGNLADIDLSTSYPYPLLDKYRERLAEVQRSVGNFEVIRKKTGISKPSLFSGLYSPFGVPGSFPLDTMHLLALNIPDILVHLWMGTFKCYTHQGDSKDTWDWAVLQGNTWKEHGMEVEQFSKYLPSHYDRPPRNPAEKINSGYKAAEFIVYIYGYLPVLLIDILPLPYLLNFHRLVRAVRLISQHVITVQNLLEAKNHLIVFLEEFEDIYVQRKVSRMHFVCQCLHALWHLAFEIHRLGPPCIYAQWTMERTIGNLGQDIRLHSNPYSNLAKIGVERCVINTLITKFPELDHSIKPLPSSAISLSQDYVFLHPHDSNTFSMTISEQDAFCRYLRTIQIPTDNPLSLPISRHARLQLPNKQVVRTAWKEDNRPDGRRNRMVKLKLCEPHHNTPLFGEVLYFFSIENTPISCAMISLTSTASFETLSRTFNTVWLVDYQRYSQVEVVNVTNIESVIALLPYKRHPDCYFVLEDITLGIAEGIAEEAVDA